MPSKKILATPTPAPIVEEPLKAPEITALPGRGVDIGTANIAHCSMPNSRENMQLESIRDCFLALPFDEQYTLGIAGIPYSISSDDKHALVIDIDAAQLASAQGMELRRPLAQGFISDKEDLSKEVVKLILSGLLEGPRVPGELAVFSVPGEPLDSRTSKAQYHTRFFANLLRELGFTPMPINEAMAVCFSETINLPQEQNPLTGLCFSFGAGMINVALAYKSQCLRSFSLPFGGDWIDEAVANTTNTPLTQVTLLKEEGLNLTTKTVVTEKPHHDAITKQQAEALGDMYRELLVKLRDALNRFFSRPENRVGVREQIPVIVSGGTSMAHGFLDLFDEIVLGNLETRLPLAKKSIHAREPLNAVAMGAMQVARLRADSVGA